MSRLITGVILIAIGVYVLGNGGFPLFAFLSIIGCLAFYEVRNMTELNAIPLMIGNILVYLTLMTLIFLKALPTYFDGIFLVGCGGIFSIMLYEFWKKSLLFRGHIFFNNIKFFLYIFLGFSSIYMIRESLNGVLFIVLTFLSIWATDVFAYYGGKRFGVRPLSPTSPNKTKEGTLIGVLSAMALVLFVCLYYGYPLWAPIIAGGIGIMAQLGDLYESLIKRTYNVKDSSNLLPGHGGILDRADSSLFVAPMVYVIIVFLS
jgi:phosphatidate cytidylyltransferase